MMTVEETTRTAGADNVHFTLGRRGCSGEESNKDGGGAEKRHTLAMKRRLHALTCHGCGGEEEDENHGGE